MFLVLSPYLFVLICMKTILLISPYWKEQHRWMVSSVKLAELWQRMGYRVVCVCMGSKTRKENVSDTLTIYHVKDFFLPDPLNYGIAPTFLFHVLRVLKTEKPDIVIVNKVLFWSSLVTPILRLLGRKPIVTTDALVGITWHPRGFFSKIIMGIGGWTAGWLVLLSAKKLVFFHQQPERILRVLGIRGKSRVIPTGIDSRKYMACHPEKKSCFETSPSGSPQHDITVTYIGRLESVKGVNDFLAAVVPLKKDYLHMKIQVVGWYKDNHPLVLQYEREVIFTGLRDDIPDLLSETDIFVLPSYSEGLSNALMEAMASGCACIASEVGGNRSLIENGVSGFLFPPGDRAMLQAHIRRLLEDSAKRESLGQAAQDRIKESFDWSKVEQKYATLFADVSA